jgi:hypothetical protein
MTHDRERRESVANAEERSARAQSLLLRKLCLKDFLS